MKTKKGEKMKKKSAYRPAVFIVLYKREKDEIMYLLLKRKLHWKGWEFSKGKIEKGESKVQAAKREAREESGLRIIKIKKFNISGKYKYPKLLPDRPGYIGQTYTLLAGEVKPGKVKLDKKEHSGFSWQPFKKAVKMLTWRQQRRCLRIVNKSLMRR